MATRSFVDALPNKSLYTGYSTGSTSLGLVLVELRWLPALRLVALREPAEGDQAASVTMS
jgi:hypothetical protein